MNVPVTPVTSVVLRNAPAQLVNVYVPRVAAEASSAGAVKVL